MRIWFMVATAIVFVAVSVAAWNTIILTEELSELAICLVVLSFMSWLALVIQIGGLAAIRGRSVWLWVLLACVNVWLAWGILIALPIIAISGATYRMLRGKV